jgi:hypothetical protein
MILVVAIYRQVVWKNAANLSPFYKNNCLND